MSPRARRLLSQAAGCDKGAYKAYCGPQLANAKSGLRAAPVLAAHRALARRGLGLGKICKSGAYSCATIEHYAAFAPAFGRRPYISERNASLVVRAERGALVLGSTRSSLAF